MSAVFDVQVRQHVTDAPVVVSAVFGDLSPQYVEWRAYAYKGGYYEAVTALDGDGQNETWVPIYDDIPDWVPEPPPWFRAAADEIEASVGGES